VVGGSRSAWASFGALALASGKVLPLQVCKSAAGFYLGTQEEDGSPYSRESKEYWPNRPEAEDAIMKGEWTQRPHP
jgi:hypothetical protein